MPRPAAAPLPRWQEWTATDSLRALAFLLLHAPLALAFSAAAVIAQAFIVVVLLVGLWYALVHPRLERVAYIGGYFIGSEVLWRMTGSNPFWETGKYSIVLLFVLALLRTDRLRGPFPIFVYFGSLLPSLVLPMANVANDTILGDISYYLSGPLALTVSTWFFTHVKLTATQLQRLFTCLAAPTVGVGAIAVSKVLSAQTVVFTNSSNFATSGGFGPNQVSAALGLGALIVFLAGMMNASGRIFKVFCFALALGLVTLSALTFSRTGFYTAALTSLIAAVFLIREPRLRFQMLAGLALVIIVGYFLVLPRLDTWTEGKLGKRLANTTLTGRDRIALGDIQIFLANPLFGIGPGQARDRRSTDVGVTAAHTEFSRLLAEHGVFGLLAVAMLVLLSFVHFHRARSPEAQALVASTISWSFLFMAVSAMRLAAPAFMFGLSAVTLLTAPSLPTETTHKRKTPLDEPAEAEGVEVIEAEIAEPEKEAVVEAAQPVAAEIPEPPEKAEIAEVAPLVTEAKVAEPGATEPFPVTEDILEL
jgi:hypothetical protein